MRLADRRIIITGGGSGIGLETALRFQAEGARIAVLDRSPKSLDTARTHLPQAVVVECDVSHEASVQRAVEAAAEGLGGIDGICNVAGIGTRKSFEETTAEAMMTDIGVNLMGPFLVSKAALPHLRAAGGGTIVNVASGLALRPTEGRTAYGASKGGLIVMSKAMAIDLAKDKVRVNVVCPGLIDTPLVKDTSHGASFTPQQYEKLMDRRIIRRMGEAREIADAMLFLTSNESSFITATVLAVDGGGSMH
ncbi:SDR family NAD(P)-dependent oxidoreductase [Variovorax sp. KK3]|uniref:SDR family NAD(P)-dependent oxidoreductase n=1 Tax=Variovorax sp. KK3 TaxID=1855728 RepID=UPI00097C3360|nr:SDR family oxidoreductase [Variovorax sp. KK3]